MKKIKSIKTIDIEKWILLGITLLILGGMLIIVFIRPVLIDGLFSSSNVKGASTAIPILTPNPTTEYILPTVAQNTPIPTSIPSPTTKPYYPPPTTNPDPIVSCNLYECGTIQIKKSQCQIAGCCIFGNKYVVYYNQSQCRQDQEAYYNNRNNNNSAPANSPLPTYPPCVVYYPILGYSQTYTTFSPEYCKQMQDNAAAISPQGSTSTAPQPTQDPQVAISAHNNQVNQCRNNVVSKYQGIMQGCNQYGGSSAAGACISINTSNRNSEYNNCGSLL